MGLVDLAKSDISYKKYFDSTSYLRGYEGKCFIEGDKILKFYFFSKEKKDFIDLSVYHSPYISFPINYFEIFGKIVGEEMPYFNKLKINESINIETDLQLLKQNYVNILKEISKFKELYMDDMCKVNILYNENGFSLIDTSRWQMRDINNSRQVSNEALFNEYLMDRVSEVLNICRFNIDCSLKDGLLSKGKIGEDILNLLKNALRDSFYLIEVLEAFEHMYNKEYGNCPKTLGDIENYTKILKNS